MKNFLQEIISLKKKEVSALKAKRPMSALVDSKHLLKGVRHFKEAISNGSRINLIAEIKKKSPSRVKGFFRRFDLSGVARIYAENGAKAISVLTDKEFFGGDISHINEVRTAVNIPVLRKDFIVDEYQVYESCYFGADAILLIARILAPDEIKSFMYLAKRIGMDSIVEVHDEDDLRKALVAKAEIIGINNRDLDTFKVNLDTTLRLAPEIPKGVIVVSESGIKDNEDILKLRHAGVNAVLIGEAFLEAKDIAARVKEIMS